MFLILKKLLAVFVVSVTKPCLILFRLRGLYSLLGSSVHRISQARILEQVAISYSRGYSRARD